MVNVKRWFWWHGWSSLVCTLFLLLLCFTGLPLIFAEELVHYLDPAPSYAQLSADTPMASLNTMESVAKARYPGQITSSIFVDDDEPQVLITMVPSLTADPKLSHTLQFDSRTAKLLKDEPPVDQQPQTFLGLMFSLHIDLFMGLPGELFMGAMGLLFVVSIISGIVLYGPFMKKLDFGTIRRERSPRLKWLDLHNLLGIATAAWLLVVGITGVINELSAALFGTTLKRILLF